MSKEAEKTLKKHSGAIAKSLCDGALKGNATSAILLFELADGKIDCEDEVLMSRLCIYAEKLAFEPEWQGDPSAETEVEDGDPED